jgi:hypothetical protein
MLDRRAHRNLKLIGVEFAPMAGSEPFEYLGSPATQALYVPFADLEPAPPGHPADRRAGGRPGGLRDRPGRAHPAAGPDRRRLIRRR